MKKRLGWLGFWLGLVCLAVFIVWSTGNEPDIDSVAQARQETGVDFESGFVAVNGIRLRVVTAGDPKGQPVVLLHGFPESWYAWRLVAAQLAPAGLRVIIPDQRGYGLSDKPHGLDAYRTDVLADDIAALIVQMGYRQAVVVGQDWGGGVAWDLAIRHPDAVRGLIALDTPHPGAMRGVATDQRRINWYQMAFQLPGLPELCSRAFHWAIPTAMLRQTAEPGAFPDAAMAVFRSAWDHDGAYSAMVNWYRANPLDGSPLLADKRVTVPTLILMAPADAFFPQDFTKGSLRFLDKGRLEELSRGTHWVAQEHPDELAQRIIGFCSAKP